MINTPQAKDLIIPLFRPEYPAVPEAFLSALAWKAYSPTELPAVADGKKLGLRFKIQDSGTVAKSIDYKETVPISAKFEELQSALERYGVESLGAKDLVAGALIHSVEGTSKNKSRFIPASPLTPSLALMQNVVGALGKANPPDIAYILEQIYYLGKSGATATSVAALYAEACEIRLKNDAILATIEKSLADVVWGGISLRSQKLTFDETSLSNHLSKTPFSWFADAWDKVTSDNWVKALPARVWVDWATTILRSGYAMAYLWESCWYEAVAKLILSNTPSNMIDFETIKRSMDFPIDLRPIDTPTEIKDLGSKLKWRNEKSVQIRKVLMAWLDEENFVGKKLHEFIELARANESFLIEIEEALNPDKSKPASASKLLWEATKYSLVTRELNDYYGLLQSNGRYLFTNPGVEWCAMVASLTSPSPGISTNLGSVVSELQNMGIRSSTNEVLRLLEKAGLARGSADADLAVEVECAYKGASK